MKTKIALIAILLMSCVTAYAQDFTIERGQTISGPEAQSPTDAPPGLQVNSQGANNLLIANYGHVIGPAGRGIIAHQRGPGSSTVIDSGVVRGEGVDCPGGEAGASRSYLHGMIGCSAIRNVITNNDASNDSTEKTRVNKTAVGTSAGINNVNNGQGATIAVVGPHGRVNGIHEFGIENEITGNGTVSVRTDSGSLVRSRGDGIVIADTGNGSVQVVNKGSVVSGNNKYDGALNEKNSVGFDATVSIISSYMSHIVNTGLIEAKHGYALQSSSLESTLRNFGRVIGAVATPGSFTNKGIWEAGSHNSQIGTLDLKAKSNTVDDLGSRIIVSGSGQIGGTLTVNPGKNNSDGWHVILRAASIVGQFKSVVSQSFDIVGVRYTGHSVAVKVSTPANNNCADNEKECFDASMAAGSVGHGGAGAGAAAVDLRDIEGIFEGR